MASVVSLTFNPFQENTYLVIADNNSCAVFDPGCFDLQEKTRLANYIENHDLEPEWLINTHCHIDHVFGNKFVADRYGLQLAIHPGELDVLHSVEMAAQMFGIPFDLADMVEPGIWLKEGETVSFGGVELKMLFTPGHSPASLSFYNEKDGYVIGGDVLFQGSIGRYDLPGGNLDTLLQSIRQELMTLPDEVIVYPGHGPATTIGAERRSNPFLQ